MAWITPVTNRADGTTRTTFSDMNRICGNINYAYQAALKDDYIVSDIVTDTQWTQVITNVNEMADIMELTHATTATDYANLNQIELITQVYKELLLTPDDSLYPAENQYPNIRRT